MITDDRAYASLTATSNTPPTSAINGIQGGILANLYVNGGWNCQSYSFLDGVAAVGLASDACAKYSYEFANETNFVAAGLAMRTGLASPDPGQVGILLDNIDTNVTIAGWSAVDMAKGCWHEGSSGHTEVTTGVFRCHVPTNGSGFDVTGLLNFSFGPGDIDAVGSTGATGLSLTNTYQGRIDANFHDIAEGVNIQESDGKTLDYLYITGQFGPFVATPLSAALPSGALGHNIVLAGAGIADGNATDVYWDDWAFGAGIAIGTGSPAGSVAGGVGMFYRQLDGAAGSQFWGKTSGAQICSGTPIVCLPPTSTSGWVQFVDLSSAQTLTNKSIAAAEITGLGTAATVNTGTSGGVLGLLNGALTFSGALSFTGGITANGSNVSDTFSPTGSGTVTIKPATAGAIDNVVIGGTTPLVGTFTALNATAGLIANGAAIALNIASSNHVNVLTGASSGNLHLNDGTGTGTTNLGNSLSLVTIAGSTNQFASPIVAQADLKVGSGTGHLLCSTTAPTISSGFGTSHSIVASNGTCAFQVNVGTGGTANSGVIGLPTATTGWVCMATDITTSSTTVFITKQTASSTTSCTLGNFNDVAAAAAWSASDKLQVIATAY